MPATEKTATEEHPAFIPSYSSAIPPERRISPSDRVSRGNPCPICSKVKGCLAPPPRSDGSRHVVCLRVPSDKPASGGLGGWVHLLNVGAGSDYKRPSPLPCVLPSARLAPPEARDRVYRATLAAHPLLELHKKELLRRGLFLAAIEALGFCSWGWDKYQRRAIATEVYAMHREALDVPGFIVREQARGAYVSLGGDVGIAIPVVNVAGQIVGLQILRDNRSDGQGKYRWLSSSRYGGPSSGTPVHVAYPKSGTSSKRVWLTEGALKADIAAERLGEIVIAIPGVHALRGLPQTLSELVASGQLTDLVVALDMDHLTNSAVGEARALIPERAARDHGIPVYLADWDPAYKGLDDLLVAGGKPRLTSYQVVGNGPRALEPAVAPQPTSTPGLRPAPIEPTVSLKSARRTQEQALDELLADPRPGEGIILGALPGTGKSTTITKCVDKATRRFRRRIALFVSRHDLARSEGRENWRFVRGRTHEIGNEPTPCAYPKLQRKLVELRVTGQMGCHHCPKEETCKTNTTRANPEEPFYLSQLKPVQEQRVTVYQSAHVLTPSAYESAQVLIFDDVALRDLQLEQVQLSRSDLEKALCWSELHATSPYGNAQPLLHLVVELTRQTPVGPFTFDGQGLLDRLQDLARQHKIDFSEVLSRAKQAKEPDPFPAGATLTSSKLDTPKRFVADLVAVLAHEYAQAQLDREVGEWNRRIEVSRKEGEDVFLVLNLRRDLPDLSQKTLVLSDASINLEEAQRAFPGIKWKMVAPKVTMPSAVRVIQHPSRAWNKRALYDPKAQQKAIERIRKVIEAYPGKRIGCITFKFLGAILLKEFPQLLMGHFYGQRGSNAFENCDVLIVFGVPRPNPESFRKSAEALHWNEHPLDRRTILKNHTIGGLRVKAREYVDPRLRELARSKTQDELVQAIYRIRPLSVKISKGEISGQTEFDFHDNIAGETEQERRAAIVHVFANVKLPGINVEVQREVSSPPMPRPGALEATPSQLPVMPQESEPGSNDSVPPTPNPDPYLRAAATLIDKRQIPTELRLAEQTSTTLHQVGRWKSQLESQLAATGPHTRPPPRAG